MGYRVLVTRPIPEEGIDALKGKCEKINLNPENRSWDKTELIKNLSGNDGVLCLLTDKIDKDVLMAAKLAGIKGFANMAVGYDNIDVETATQLGIMVTNTPGVLTETTAELAWALIFAVARRIVEADKFTRAGKFKGWEPLLFLGQDISHKTLGIIGAGRIGGAVAKMSCGFNMRILYYDQVRRPELETQLKAEQTSLTELLKTADIISIHTPLTTETYHLIGAAEIKLMKPTAILINTSRGPVVDEAALAFALKNRQIAGAGLDVYE
ncbi:MAG: D-glycerate dehydrogenase, partial [Candidatus Sumerlaeia bacterium]|nr:D-glycerate dehydrogenase [Candidatus Sumerlaeia bacterium]